MSWVRYYNHHFQLAESRWERRQFLGAWWRVYAGDPRWVPPFYPALRRELVPEHNPHLARLAPIFLRADALPRPVHEPKRNRRPDPFYSAAARGFPMEEPVAAAVLLRDPRRSDCTGYLALLHCANDAETMVRLLDQSLEVLTATGCRRLIGPTGLSPYLETGLLHGHWDELPPLHTPYGPPYLPEVLEAALGPLPQPPARLYHLKVPPEPPPTPSAPARLVPLVPAHLAGNLVSLLVTACASGPVPGAPPPDEQEAAFLLRWLQPSGWPLTGWLALAGDQPAGLILLQPDLAPLVWQAKGGRRLARRLWLSRAVRRSKLMIRRPGRLLYGAVLPEHRGRGIGRLLLHRALLTAHEHGWLGLTIGPLPPNPFLEHHGARARQTYLLYGRDV